MDRNALMKLLTRSSSFCLVLAVLAGPCVSADPLVFESVETLRQSLSSFKGVVLVLGFDKPDQYANVQAVAADVDLVASTLNIMLGSGQWTAVFDGTPYDPERPDVAFVIKHLKDAHGVPAMAMKANLLPALTLSSNRHLIAALAVGGGARALEEARYLVGQNIPIIYVRAEARHPAASGRYGALDDWAFEKAAAHTAPAIKVPVLDCAPLLTVVKDRFPVIKHPKPWHLKPRLPRRRG